MAFKRSAVRSRLSPPKDLKLEFQVFFCCWALLIYAASAVGAEGPRASVQIFPAMGAPVEQKLKPQPAQHDHHAYGSQQMDLRQHSPAARAPPTPNISQTILLTFLGGNGFTLFHLRVS